MHLFHMLGVAGVFGGFIFSAIYVSLVTFSRPVFRHVFKEHLHRIQKFLSKI